MTNTIGHTNKGVDGVTALAILHRREIEMNRKDEKLHLEYEPYIHEAERILDRETVNSAEQQFDQSAHLRSLIVVDEMDRPRGIIMRDRFYEIMSKRFAPALYHGKSICRLMDVEVLTLEYGIDTSVLLDGVGLRSEERMYDSVIITKEDKLYGIINPKSITALSKLMRNKHADNERAVVNSTLRALSGINEEAEMVRNAASEGYKHADGMTDETLIGKSALDRMTLSFGKVSKQLDVQIERVEELRKHTTNVASSVRIIRSWSEKCRLLALNASIEAARAGEHGRGFQVVATEVGQLAALTKTATDQIEEMLHAMQTALTNTVVGNEQCVTEANATQTELAIALQQLERLFRTIGGNRKRMADMNELAQLMSDTAKNAHKELTNISKQI